jgi:hypothetical protein
MKMGPAFLCETVLSTKQTAARGQIIMSIRPVKRIIESKPTIEGAGVKLRRAFGFGDTGEFDCFSHGHSVGGCTPCRVPTLSALASCLR